MDFTFIHAADLHIDSPFAGLGAKDPDVAARFRGAGRRAIENLRDEAIRSKAAFLLIAGDVFDGAWGHVETGLFFARILGELSRAGIPVFIVKGNHDAVSVVVRDLPVPEGVVIFDAGKAETRYLEHLQVAIHGRSFGDRAVPPDFAASYPARRDGWLNIGMLHTSLAGESEHEVYAPCSADQLKAFGYDYWALGHVHEHRIVASGDPWIVYPGNVQGRHARETGPKGAVRVTVKAGRVSALSSVPLDCARWAHADLDISGVDDLRDVMARIDGGIGEAQANAGDLPLAIRITLSGSTSLHERLVAGLCDLDDVRALAAAHGSACWVEKIRVATKPLSARSFASQEESLEIQSLVDAACDDPAFHEALQKALAAVCEKAPKSLAGEIAAEIGDIAAFGDQARAYLLGMLARDHGA